METDGKGALPMQEIRKLVAAGAIIGAKEENIKPSSLDLSISDEVYRVERIFLPTREETVRDLLYAIGGIKHDLRSPMERGVTYLARLNEKLKLPQDIYAFCNPKSSTGRNDIHVRVLADRVPRYDEVTPRGWEGELWVAITPKSYPVILPTGFTLSQIRFLNNFTIFNEGELISFFEKEKLIYEIDGSDIAATDQRIVGNEGLIALSLDLSDDIVGYECLEPNKILDLALKNSYDYQDFFRPLKKSNGSLILRSGKFYILSAKERVRVPPSLACEMWPMDERYGDFRAHYAGFIDPGWGWGKEGEGKGRTLTLEVRPFEDLELREGQSIAKIRFEKMAALPEEWYDIMDSNYLAQHGPKLAKQFKI